MYKLLTLLIGSLTAFGQQPHYGFGRQATSDEIRTRNITVLPDGTGLPIGKGNAVAGQSVYREKCATCHNDRGEGREHQYPALTGGKGTLATVKPVKTVGNYWPYATTVWDYIHRAMPFDNPRTLSTDEVYAVTAFILYLNNIVPENQELNEKTLPKITMPNRNGFIPDRRPDIKSQR